ncbi:gamma-glutamylcyclotransferase [Roseomonas gilardii subsp. gilardii]|uniref:gamma-glutamylcyclotransferase n=1 Tax=Roseomonas gilardii TaxID=257708 RepID=UPI001FF90220|nr:gamma-glutamylcyclotransferase [Roseomonas gilardii]UPG74064.1 gamma-glutamylcyclotransferase [Roseomonas gilardii subsp. gilardii]
MTPDIPAAPANTRHSPDTEAPPVLDEALLDADGSLYVFAYGSLIWKPGFAADGTHPALLRGYHRRFCIRSTRYRGTPERPGLVLGLDRGGACRGVALRVARNRAAEVLDYLHEREMSGGSYHQMRLKVRLLDEGREVRAVAYVVDRRSDTYCGGLEPDEAARTIGLGIGAMGSNRDYLLNTVSQLRALGVRDAALERLADLLPPDAGGDRAGEKPDRGSQGGKNRASP